jgi:4,4'-diaponeurosporenoate glycosyltransferase
MELFFWLFLGLAFLFWIAGWTMSARFRAVPPANEDVTPSEVKISVIIPARNEEENLGRLLPSLRKQGFSAHEILVVDDQSEDRTAEVSRENEAIVVRGQPLPEGWYGKPWACQQGARTATGDWFLFLDADTVLEDEALHRIASLSREEDCVHSICPAHRVPTPVEQLSAFFNVIMILGMNAFTLRGHSAKGVGLFGQVMLVSRDQYDAVGGHEPARSEVLENFHLSRHFVEAGYRCRCYLGRGTIWMRMFPDGYRDLVSSWSKGFVSGASNTPRSAVIGISFWLSGLIMATVALTFLPQAGTAVTVAVLTFYLLGVIQCLWLFRNAGTYSIATSLLFPIGLFFYQSVFFKAILRKRRGEHIQWKGRDVI